jgi:hypothetical protein
VDFICEVERTMNPIRFGWRDLPGFLLVAAIIIGWLFVTFKYLDWHKPSGFGPEWQCSPTGKGGPDFCVKKPQADSTKQE